MAIRSTREEFTTKATEIYGDKYDYTQVVYKNARLKVKLRCRIHNKRFEQAPHSLLIGREGCNKCQKEAEKAFVDSIRYTTADFIRLSKEVHGDKYDYSPTEYIDSLHQVKIRCVIHDYTWETDPQTHYLQGCGCPKCGDKKKGKNGKTGKLTTEKFVLKATAVHGDRFDYTDTIYEGCDTPASIRCVKHSKVFFQRPDNHLNGKVGCTKCINSKLVSKSEVEWLEFLGLPDDDNHRQVRLSTAHIKKRQRNHVQVDGFDPETNTVYEFYGDYWHGNPAKFKGINKFLKKPFTTLYKETMIREKRLRDAGYKVIAIWESDWIELKTKWVSTER